jgi:hypothetical protein
MLTQYTEADIAATCTSWLLYTKWSQREAVFDSIRTLQMSVMLVYDSYMQC